MGLIYVYHCADGQMLVCLDPQLIGCMLQRTLQACQVSQETNPGSIFLAITHLCMMWGVEPILNLDKDSSSSKCSAAMTSAHLLHFLQHLRVFSPLLPGVMLLTPILPHTLPRSCDPDSTHLTPRRSYVFSYLPSHFHIHLISRIISAIVAANTPLTSSPTSPNLPSPPPTIPVVLPSGTVKFCMSHACYMLYACCQHVSCYMHVACMFVLHACYLHVCATCYYMRVTCMLHTTCMLSALTCMLSYTLNTCMSHATC